MADKNLTPDQFLSDQELTPDQFLAEDAKTPARQIPGGEAPPPPEAPVPAGLRPPSQSLPGGRDLIGDDVNGYTARPTPQAAVPQAAPKPAPAAKPGGGMWDQAVDVIHRAATGHAIQSLGGPTLGELYDRVFPPENGKSALAQAAEFSRRIGRTLPEIGDFLLTPLGSLTVATGGAPAEIQSAIGAYFGASGVRQLAPLPGDPESGQAGRALVEHPGGGTAADALKAGAMAALPLAHARGAAKSADALEQAGAEGAGQAAGYAANPPYADELGRLSNDELAAEAGGTARATPERAAVNQEIARRQKAGTWTESGLTVDEFMRQEKARGASAPEVPETGEAAPPPPESQPSPSQKAARPGKARGLYDQRNQVARELTGKTYGAMDADGRTVVDSLLKEGREPKPQAEAPPVASEETPSASNETTAPETAPESEAPARETPIEPTPRSGQDTAGSEPAPPAKEEQPKPAAVRDRETKPSAAANAAERAPGWTGEIPTSEIHVDAPRFQFKQNVGQGGAGEELRGVAKWDPEMGGILSVWKDPSDGKTYVVNGHHRVELAQRLNVPEMTVRYLDAPDAKGARLKGALINIAEGRGESTDAAKILRDSGMTPEEVAGAGVSIKGKLASEGIPISRLAQPIFDDVMAGSLAPARGAILGGVANPADQTAIYDLIRQRERGGQRLTDETIRELVRMNDRTSTRTETTAGQAQGRMFGDEELTRSLLPEKAEVSAFVRKQLAGEKKLFGLVGTEAAAEKLNAAGNVIRAGENAQVAERANQRSALYDKLSTRAGAIDDILDRTAREIADGQNASDAKQRAYGAIREHLKTQLDRLAGVRQGDAGGTEGGGESGRLPSGAGQHDQLDARGNSGDDAGRAGALPGEVAPDSQTSLVSPADEAESQGTQQSASDRLLHDQLTAQVKSGGAVKPAGLKPAENRGLFDESAPESGDLFEGEESADPNSADSLAAEFRASGLKAGSIVPTDAEVRAAAEQEAARHAAEKSQEQANSNPARTAGRRRAQSAPAGGPDRGQTDGQTRGAAPDSDAARPGGDGQRNGAGAGESARPVARAAGVFARAKDAILKVIAPAARAGAQKAALVVRYRAAELARRTDQAKAALDAARTFFASRPAAENLDFVDRIETGRGQADPARQQMADTMRQMLDERRALVQALGTGKLQSFYENYFPHLWKDPEHARQVFTDWFAKRPMEGARSFLKQRSIPTVKDGVAAGLDPASDNPVDLVLSKVREMDKYLMAHHTLADLKEQGLVKYVPSFEKPAPGYARIDDPIATVYGPPSVQAWEGFDKHVMEGLQAFADSLGITHERSTGIGGRRAGFAEENTGRVVTRFGGPESVLAHEIGHQLDWKYGLSGELSKVKGAGAELRALADLRYEGEDVPASFKKYVRQAPEKMAALVEAYVHAPERLKEVAPNTFQWFSDFIHFHPELEPLNQIRPSMVLGSGKADIRVPGMVIAGQYYAPEPVARVVNNYLSPGLRNSTLYRAYIGAANHLNQFQLGYSAFHLGFTSAEAAISKFALGVYQAAHGMPLEAVKSIASTPFAPFTNLVRGDRMLKEWYRPGTQGAETAEMVDAMVRAGGRARMDSFYQTTMATKMMDAFRRGNVPGAVEGVARAPFAATELAVKPVLEWIVPRQKMGVFADLARTELDKLAPGATPADAQAALAKAWDSVDNRMGQLVYDNLFWNKTAKDLAMASVRSVGWNIGTLREIGGGAGDWGKFGKDALTPGRKAEFTTRMSYVTALPIVAGIANATFQYLATGQGPQELKDYFVPRNGNTDERGRPERVFLPTYERDLVHAYYEPGKTVTGKIHPLLTTMAEMLQNQDFYGVKLRNEDDPAVRQLLDVAKHLGRQFEPLASRNLRQQAQEGAPLAARLLPMIGITKAPALVNKTPAERLMDQFGHERAPVGGRTAAAAERSKQMGQLTRGVRLGQDVSAQAKQAVASGILTPKDLTLAAKNAATPEFVARFKRLPLGEAVQVFEAATAKERSKELRAALLLKVLNKQKNATPEERRALLPRAIGLLRPVGAPERSSPADAAIPE